MKICEKTGYSVACLSVCIMRNLAYVFILYIIACPCNYLVFEAISYCVALSGLEFSVWTQLASNSQRMACFLPSKD